MLYRSRSRAGVVESVDTVYFTMGRRYGFMMNDHFQHGIMHDRYASGTPGFDTYRIWKANDEPRGIVLISY